MAKQEIIKRARTEKRTQLTEMEAKLLLKEAGLNVVETKLATSKDEALSISEMLGFPVAIKISSIDVLHKSDAGGVKLGVKPKSKSLKPMTTSWNPSRRHILAQRSKV